MTTMEACKSKKVLLFALIASLWAVSVSKIIVSNQLSIICQKKDLPPKTRKSRPLLFDKIDKEP